METLPLEKDEYEPTLQPEWVSAQKACELLQEAGYEALLVGGCVRDLLLGIEPKDYDIATNASPAQVESTSGFDKAKFNDTSQAFAVTRAMLDGLELEIASFRRDVDAHLGRANTRVQLGATLEDDLARRDLTINALALDPVTMQLHYVEPSLSDLDEKIIRFVGEPAERIAEDPLRLLRAVRFKNRFEFSYSPDTLEAITSAVEGGEIASISGERLRDELTALFKTAHSRKAALEDLDNLGILSKLFPEFTEGKGVDQGPEYHAEGDVFTHQLLIMEALPADASTELIWSAFLHDIGKPHTQKVPVSGEDGRITFHGHAEVSTDLARDILNRLKFSNTQKDHILWLIAHHINVKELPEMKRSKQNKMLNHPAFADLLELHRADGKASWSTQPDGSIVRKKGSFDAIERIWQEHQARPPEAQAPDIKRDLGIDGKVIIELMEDFNPKTDSKTIGVVIKILQELYADGEITSREDGIAKATEIITQIKKAPSSN